MTSVKLNRMLILSTAAVLIVPAGQASAQSSDEDSATLVEVTVTARRIEESMQETPISISVFDDEELRNKAILSTEQLDQTVPNLQFTNDTTLAGNNNSSNIFIRGVGQVDPTSTMDPGVGMYIDDVYIGSLSAAR